MKFESSPKTAEDAGQSKFYSEVKQELSTLCQVYDNPADRIDLLLNKAKPLLRHIDPSILSEEQAQTVCDGIKACAAIDNQAEFIVSLLDVLKPVIDLGITNLSELDGARIAAINETHGWSKLNQLLQYGKSGAVVHLHVPVGENVFNKREQYYDGLAKLAKIIEEDSEIQWVEAASFIVAEHPGLFTRDNFIISEVTEEFKQKHFPNEIREIKKASINREEFLNKFLPKNS